MELISDPKVKLIFDNYPKAVRNQVLKIRALILDVASEIENLEQLEEVVRWGEPSYVTKHGSTMRLNWTAKKPEQFAVFFQCTSRLVPTFKIIYENQFQFEGSRAIVFQLGDKIPNTKLRSCILMALTYHKIKHLPLLGA